MTRKEIRKELVEQYAEGQISRRSFLRRLAGTGVSLGAALTYASVIGAEKAMAVIPSQDLYNLPELPEFYPPPLDDHYPDIGPRGEIPQDPPHDPTTGDETGGGGGEGTTTEHDHLHPPPGKRRHHGQRHRRRHSHAH